MELSVTPAGSLRLWQAMGDCNNGVKHCLEPGMQADQWGEVASATSDVRSNGTLDLASCLLNFLCTFLLLDGRPYAIEKIRKMFTSNSLTEVPFAVYASTQLCVNALTHFAF